MTAIRRFSRYLKENNKEVDSCSKLDRKIMEEYLIYMKTEDTGTKKISGGADETAGIAEYGS